jgi:predicted nucleotidyltransferase
MNRVGDTLLHFGPNQALVRAFVDAGVEFVIIGGLAVAWHRANRQADDMDLLVNPTAENSSRIARVLDRLNIRGVVTDSFARLGLQVPLKQTFYADLLTPEKDGATYVEIVDNSVAAKIFSIPVRLASVSSLIAMKARAVAAAEAQRDKHQADLELLGNAV